jgi:hypothetical protein
MRDRLGQLSIKMKIPIKMRADESLRNQSDIPSNPCSSSNSPTVKAVRAVVAI